MKKKFVHMADVGRTYMQHGKIPVKALASVTCSIFPKDRIAITGPSGSGKSTLLHLMAGLDSPTSGMISWPALGSIKDLRPEKISIIFQSNSLIASLNVVENVEMPLLLQGIKPSKARAAALEAIEKISLGSIAFKLPEELSGGQAQRVAVARTFASDPKLIIADEPTGQLDHPTAKQMFDVFLAFIENSDAALVVATHDPAVANRMDKIWQIQYGRVEVTDEFSN